MDRLAAPEERARRAADARLDGVAVAAQRRRHLGRDSVLERDDDAATVGVGRARRLIALQPAARGEAEARRVERSLRVHSVEQQVEQQLHVTLRLHEAAHHAKRRHQLVAAAVGRRRQHAGNDRVERPLPRAERIRVAVDERKVGAAVVQREAAAGGHEAAPKAHVIRVDERARVAIGVDGAQVHGVRAVERQRRVARHRRRHRRAGRDQRGARARVRVVEQRGRRAAVDGGVGDGAGGGVGKRESQRLGQ